TVEAAELLAVVRIHVRQVPGEILAELDRPERQANLACLALHVRNLLAHAIEERTHPRIRGGDGTGRWHDAARLNEDRTIALIRQPELGDRIEVEIDEAALIQVARVDRFRRQTEPVRENRPVP